MDKNPTNPLWIISFSRPQEGKQSAHLQKAGEDLFPLKKGPLKEIPTYPPLLGQFAQKDPLFALDLLDHLNECFKAVSDAYFEKIPKTPELEMQAKEIHEKFDSLHNWIVLLKSKLNKEDDSL